MNPPKTKFNNDLINRSIDLHNFQRYDNKLSLVNSNESNDFIHHSYFDSINK